jgi:hypothetical protein
MWLLFYRELNTMLDTDSLLMASIFQKAYPLDPQPPAAIFLHRFGFEINRTCRVLKLLGLVEEASSTLGFKPTHRLIDIITDRMVQPTVESKNAVAKVDDNFVYTLWLLAVDDEDDDDGDDDDDEDEKGDEQEDKYGIEDRESGEDAQAFFCQVLAALGLLKEEAERYVPTPLMHKLILENWVRQVSETKTLVSTGS